MPAGKHGPSEITISVDDSGGVLRDLTQYIRNDVAFKVATMLQKTNSYGDSWDESTPVGHASVDDLTLSGLYDDTATSGPHVTLAVASGDRDPQGSTRTLTIVWGNSKSSSVETRLLSYKRGAKVEGLTEFEAVLRPTGAVTEV
jgi:hypothetical protein